jgi:two-component system, chemotaxis family, chemotaxis protein CheY
VALILSADDDPDIRNLIKRIMEPAGHQVISANDGQAAVEAAFAHATELDLVILDVEMPRLRGLDACRMLRDDPRTSHLPVVIASGSLVPPYDDVQAAGANTCVRKPFSPKELRDAVERELTSAAARS